MNEVINIVCDYEFNNLLAQIDEYQLDLGKNFSSMGDDNKLKIEIKDKFLLKFLKETGYVAYKVGVMGIISVYTSPYTIGESVVVYKGDKRFDFEVDLLDAKIDIKKVLAEILMEVMA